MMIDEAIKDFQLYIERIRFRAKDIHYSGDYYATIDDVRKFARDNYGETEIR